MKTLILLFVLVGVNVLGQEPSNNAAKSQYKMYTTAIEKLSSIDPVQKAAAYKNQISQAENALNNIKKYEPGYNASALEEAIKKHKALVGDIKKDDATTDMEKLRTAMSVMKADEAKVVAEGSSGNWGQVQFYLDLYKNKYSEQDLAPYKKELEDYKLDYKSKLDERTQGKSSIKNFETEFKLVFINKRYDLTTDKEENISIIESNLVTYQKDLEAFLTTENIAKAAKLEEFQIKNCYKYALEQGNTAKSLIKDINRDNNSQYFTQKVRAVSNYCKLQSFQIKFKCYRKLFGEKPEIVALSDEIESLVKAEGTKEQLIAKSQKNKVEETKNKKMKPAVRTDAAIEAEIKNALKDKPGTIMKINLLDQDWRVVRNELTGVVTQRVQDFHLVMNTNGKCTLYDLILREDFDGTKYLKGFVTGYGTGWEILCENVK